MKEKEHTYTEEDWKRMQSDVLNLLQQNLYDARVQIPIRHFTHDVVKWQDVMAILIRLGYQKSNPF